MANHNITDPEMLQKLEEIEALEQELADVRGVQEQADDFEAKVSTKAKTNDVEKAKTEWAEMRKVKAGSKEWRDPEFQRKRYEVYDRMNGNEVAKTAAAKPVGPQGKNWNFQQWQKLRRENPRQYYSHRVQKQMIADRDSNSKFWE
jgi:hypothetical protein